MRDTGWICLIQETIISWQYGMIAREFVRFCRSRRGHQKSNIQQILYWIHVCFVSRFMIECYIAICDSYSAERPIPEIFYQSSKHDLTYKVDQCEGRPLLQTMESNWEIIHSNLINTVRMQRLWSGDEQYDWMDQAYNQWYLQEFIIEFSLWGNLRLSLMMPRLTE